jgi:hypothetical protein
LDENLPENRYQKLEWKRKTYSHNAFPDWGVLKHGAKRLPILSFLVFVYINDVLKNVNEKFKPLLFADGNI